jgi:tRNA U34 5-methylaminomethyl-2-thiouridine-forming methyltransferase MnmC
MVSTHEQPTLTPTKDGSTTLYSSRFRQHYHNPNGAVAESRYVFFETSGLPDAISGNETLAVFETGFGTGLNLLLLHEYLHQSDKKIRATYYSVEAFPVDAATASQFDFGDNPFLNRSIPALADIFEQLKPGFNTFDISERLTLHLFAGFFDNFFEGDFITEKVDFIFHDPFSPEANPGLWTPEVFKKLASVAHQNTVLSTYCAATSARAAMAVAGWYVARAPGTLGKREMTVASLNPLILQSFKRVNEKRLAERYKSADFKIVK